MYFLQIHQILWRLKNAFIHFAGFLPGFHFCEVPSLRVTLLVNEYASLSTWGAMANHKPATCLANVHWSGDRHDLKIMKIMKMMKGILFHQLFFSAYLVCQLSSVCEVSKINAWPKRPASGVEQTSRCQWVLVEWGKPICMSFVQILWRKWRRDARHQGVLPFGGGKKRLASAADYSQKAGDPFFLGVVTSYFPVPWWHTFC